MYAPLDRSSLEFVPLAFDVFGGVAPKAEHFINQLASLAVQKHHGVSEGVEFNIKYSAVLAKWKARLSAVLRCA